MKIHELVKKNNACSNFKSFRITKVVYKFLNKKENLVSKPADINTIKLQYQ